MNVSIPGSEKKSELPVQLTNFSTTTKTFPSNNGGELIRFEERKGIYTWVHPEKILFIKSADHYVKSLIQLDMQKRWMIRHCTLKEMSLTLSSANFIRLNRFYLLNLNYFSHIDEFEKTLYLNDQFSIPVPHRIARYVIDLLKKNT